MSSHLIAVFDDEFSMVKAMQEIREKDLPIEEVYTPYPIHEVIQAMGKKSRLQIAAYFYGLFGAMAILAFLYWTSVINWPIVYGGKPFNSFPSFIIITIVLTILTVTILSLATFSGRARLWPGKKHKIYDLEATDDKFVIVVSQDDELGRNDLKGILKENGVAEIREEEA